MPSSEVSNKAFNEVTAGVLQILARALQSSEGPAGHLNMATEMANIMTPAFQTHARSATEIPPILLSAAMELMEHVDHVSQTSFLSVPVWNNIKSNDSRIECHQLYGKAHKVITVSAPAPMSQPPDAPPVKATNTPAVPSVVANSKPPGRSVTRKMPIDLCEDSDEVEIVGDISQSDALHKRKWRSTSASKEVAMCHEDKVIAPAIVDKAEDVAPGNTNTTPTRLRPKPKSKRVEIVVSSGSEVPMDRQGKGREVTLPSEIHWWDRERKKSRDVSSGRPPKQASNHYPPMRNAGDQRKPWYEVQVGSFVILSLCLSHYCILQKRASTRTATHDWQHSEAMLAEQKATVAPEPVGTRSTAMQADVNAVSSQNAFSLPPSYSVKNTPTAAIPLTPPPHPTQSPPSFAKEMEVDASGDTVAKDLQAMTLEVKLDSVSPLAAVQDTINDLQTQVADIRTRNAQMAELVQIMNGRLAAQDTDIRAMEKMCAEIAVLQEEVKALHAESQTREAQIRSADAMLTAQGHRTAVLMDAYESIRQRVVPNPPIPHFNNAVFFPPAGHPVPYSQGMSARQAQAMEQLYFNFTPGPSTITGTSVPSIAAAHAGPSGSQINCPFGESASGKGPAT
ncbi:uncharacterized protein F5147DRAFT_776288 [Suillus discolor]|uniref:Uncharacterized protein n=1 Tax=Suillus discolor TaxID=1912936 RepID=A0A9P7F169_9AGAM|nr:uncharacterized protein F5147DRAFT_776288 [Suillus discolor]KAG2102541.1 hypothetical protein F5147DRAFT_776288 [Suillus discolor]